MNLELIRKYEKEFLHMLHGGKLKYFTGKEWLSYSSAEIWTGNNDLKIVIDDMYLPYRIALAEGKTVQYKMGIIANSNEPKWFDLTPKEFNSYKVKDFWDKDLGNIKGVENYRIKPEEPKFKIGDYVRYIHANSTKPLRIVNINCERYYFENAEIILRLDEIEKWEPKEGEVCLFWDDSHTHEAMIARYSRSERSLHYPLNMQHSCYQNCMPFTGALPTHMKDSR